MLKRILISIAIVMVLILPLKVHADSASPSASLKVNHLAGFFEKVVEKITLMIKFNPQEKSHYYQELLDKRLAEINFVANSDELDPLENTASRYTTYVANYATFLEQNKEKFQNKDRNNILKMAENHKLVLENIQRKFIYESGWWLSTQHDINTIKMLSEKVQSF